MGFGGELVQAAGPAAEPPTRAKPAGFGEAETACGRGRGFGFWGRVWGGPQARRQSRRRGRSPRVSAKPKRPAAGGGGLIFWGLWGRGWFGEGRRTGGGAADAARRAACPRRRRGRPAARSGRLRKNSPDRGWSGRGLRLGVGPWGGDVFAEDGV